MTSQLLFTNNARTVLASPINSSVTSLTVSSGTGALFPNPDANQYFIITMIPNSTQIAGEIMWVTARSGDVFTVARGQEGTTASSYSGGDIVSNQMTQGGFASALQLPTFSGTNPNTFLAGQAGSGTESPSAVLDSTGSIWVCTTGNTNPALAVWTKINAVTLSPANPTAIAGPSANNGSASTYMRSDASPAIQLGSNSQKGLLQADGVTTTVSSGIISTILSLITTPTTFYVNASTGVDTPTGGTIGAPWATLQYARNFVQQKFNTQNNAVTFSCTGNFIAGLSAQGALIGSQGTGGEVWQFNSGIIGVSAGTSGSCFSVGGGAAVTISGTLTLSAFTSGQTNIGLSAGFLGSMLCVASLTFGAFSGINSSNIETTSGGTITIGANYNLSGNVSAHMFASAGGSITIGSSVNCNVTTPVTLTYFAEATSLGTINTGGMTFTSPTNVTGQKYLAVLNSIINTGTGNINFFPGTIAGQALTGSQYA